MDMSGSQPLDNDIKHEKTYIFDLQKILKYSNQTSDDRHNEDYYDERAMNAFDIIDEYLEYRYSKNKFGTHLIRVAVKNIHEEFEVNKFTHSFLPHVDRLDSPKLHENIYTVNLYCDV